MQGLPPRGDMKIAVTSQNRKTVTGHAGKCRKFWIYAIEDSRVKDRTLLELPIEQSFHESHGNGPHPLDGVHVLISAGMGSGLQSRLRQKGIEALVTPETDPDQAVAGFLAGTLPLAAAEAHHDHDHEHGHHHHGPATAVVFSIPFPDKPPKE